MPMHNPPHPGEIVREECLSPLDLSVSEAAQRLGVSEESLARLANEEERVTVEMAIRLSKAFGSSPEVWLGLQTAHDIWQAREFAASVQIERIVPSA